MMAMILGVSGSPRKGGNSDIILKAILAGAQSTGTKTESVHLPDYQYQSCIGCERCRLHRTCTGLRDGMQLLYPKIRESTGLVLITPIHNHSVTAWVKAFIDRLYCLYDFSAERPGAWASQLAGQGRKAVIGTIGEQRTLEESGMDLTLEFMRRAVSALGYEIVGELPVYGFFHKGRVKESSGYLEQAEELGRNLASSL